MQIIYIIHLMLLIHQNLNKLLLPKVHLYLFLPLYFSYSLLYISLLILYMDPLNLLHQLKNILQFYHVFPSFVFLKLNIYVYIHYAVFNFYSFPFTIKSLYNYYSYYNFYYFDSISFYRYYSLNFSSLFLYSSLYFNLSSTFKVSVSISTTFFGSIAFLYSFVASLYI